MNTKRQDRRPFIDLQPIPDTGLTVEVLRNQLLHWIQVIPIARAYDNDYIDSVVNDCTIFIWDKMIEGTLSNVFICDYKNYCITAIKRRFITFYNHQNCRKNKAHQYIPIEEAFWDGEVEDINPDLSIQEKLESEEQYNLMYQAISCLPDDKQADVHRVLDGASKERNLGKNWWYFKSITNDLKYIIDRIKNGESPDEIRKLTKFKIKKTNGPSKSKKNRPVAP